MKTAVMIGAGNVGRGFIGQVFHDSGYHVVFVDVDPGLVERLNMDGRYRLHLTDGETTRVVEIDRVSAINGRETDQVAQALADCDIAATAVGQKALPHIVKGLAQGIRERCRSHPGGALNILICENIPDAASYLNGLLKPFFGPDEQHMLENTGLVETTIGRMVPLPTPELKAADPTAVLTEPYCVLPVDGKAFKGERPPLKYTVEFDPFAFFVEQKLFIHNMGHALCAYLGAARGWGMIWQAVDDEAIREPAKAAMHRLADAIAAAYGAQADGLHALADDLLRRFSNKKLGDTVARVGQDPLRKLAPGDRLVGAITRCQSQGLPYEELLLGVALALRFDAPGDLSAALLRERVEHEGVAEFVRAYCGLSAYDSQTVARLYQESAGVQKRSQAWTER